jgi:hypothetical protein
MIICHIRKSYQVDLEAVDAEASAVEVEDVEGDVAADELV